MDEQGLRVVGQHRRRQVLLPTPDTLVANIDITEDQPQGPFIVPVPKQALCAAVLKVSKICIFSLCTYIEILQVCRHITMIKHKHSKEFLLSG